MTKHGQAIVFIGHKESDHVMIGAMPKMESGWRGANIMVRCGVWSGHYLGQFLVGELTRFGREIEDLCENVKRVAEFSAVEHYL